MLPVPRAPITEHSAEPLLFASPAELDRAEVALAAPETTTGIFQSFHTPRVLLGQAFTLRQVLLGLFLVFCLTPWASLPIALALGLVLAQTVGNSFTVHTKAFTHKLLQYSVIGLSFGMNAHAAVQAGKEGILFTVVSILGTLLLGYFVGKWLGLGRQAVQLISCGTATCGGPAIAAIGPVLRAKEEEMSVGLHTV